MLKHLSALLSACLVLLLTATAFAGRDGTATYTAPSNSFNPAVTGQPIDPTDWNAILDDIEAAITESLYTDATSSTDGCLVRADGTNGRKVQNAGVCVDDTDNITGVAGATFDNGASIRTGTTAADTLVFQAYDNDTGPGYITFGTLTAGNSPSFELDNTTLDTAIAKGTWTASGTWTIPDVTFGGTLTWNGQSASGTLADLGTVTTADINGGSIDGTTVGGAVAAAGTFTTGTITTLNGVSTIDATTESTIESAIDSLPNAVGVTVQAWDDDLDDLSGLTPTKGTIMVGNGTDWVALSVGSNGQCVTAQSAQATGLLWASCGGAGSLPGDPNEDSVLVWDDAVDNQAEWASRLPSANGGVPPGTLITFTGSTCPTGYLTANGATGLLRATYADLWSAASSDASGSPNDAQYGTGNGTTTFDLPDLTTDDMHIRFGTYGTVTASGAPDIDASIANVWMQVPGSGTGAFSGSSNAANQRAATGSTDGRWNLVFEASDDDPTYSDSVTEIQVDAVNYTPCIAY